MVIAGQYGIPAILGGWSMAGSSTAVLACWLGNLRKLLLHCADQLMCSSGSQGLSVPKLARSLALDSKRYDKRLQLISKQLGVTESEVQAGKNVMRQWVAPPALLQQHQASMPPPRPPGGWLSLVQSVAQVRRYLVTPGEPILVV